MRIGEFLALLDGVRKTGANKWMARCPAHEDQHASLSVGTTDDRILINDHAGCTSEQIVARLHLTLADLFFERRNGHRANDPTIVQTYDYHDERGQVLFQVVRYEPKTFKQRRSDGAGGWIWSLGGVRRMVYRLPELAEAECAWHVEGEKDADALVALGLRATTTPGGADGWRDDFADQIKAAGISEMMLLPDNDPAGDGYVDGRSYREALGEYRALLAARDGRPIVPTPRELIEQMAGDGRRG